MTPIEEQNILLKSLLATIVELLPEHTADCGVHRAHYSYGNKYCYCKMKHLKSSIREMFENKNNPIPPK
jgi:hypothetical protein